MRNLEDIEADIEKAQKGLSKKFNDHTERSYEECEKWVQPEVELLDKLSREKRMIMPYELHEIPDYADVMTLDDFIKACNQGCFIDYDGYGHYCLNGKESSITIHPSDIYHNSIRREFDSVAWYNK